MTLATLLTHIQTLHHATPALHQFAPWPDDITPATRAPVPVPAIPAIQALPAKTPLIAAIQDAAHDVEWRQSYTADEVGADFLQAYGYFELFGPHGHFHSTQLRGYIAYWGPHLDYGWHHHAAEELYCGLIGTPRFTSKSKPDATPPPFETRHHASWEVHGMQTRDTPYLCYAVWKGPGLADLPRMSR